MKALTANRLTDGEVVFWNAGRWVDVGGNCLPHAKPHNLLIVLRYVRFRKSGDYVVGILSSL